VTGREDGWQLVIRSDSMRSYLLTGRLQFLRNGNRIAWIKHVPLPGREPKDSAGNAIAKSISLEEFDSGAGASRDIQITTYDFADERLGRSGEDKVWHSFPVETIGRRVLDFVCSVDPAR